MKNTIVYFLLFSLLTAAGTQVSLAQGKKGKKAKTEFNDTEQTNSDVEAPVLAPETKGKDKKSKKAKKDKTPVTDLPEEINAGATTNPVLPEETPVDAFANEVITNPEELTEADVAKRMTYFYTNDWKAATEKARKEQKVLVADFYTDWCRACKQMDREIFIHQDARELLSRHFVPFKANAEKNEKSVADMYGVTGYPTFIFFDASGKELKRIEGYMGKESFMKQLKQFKPRVPNTQYTPFR